MRSLCRFSVSWTCSDGLHGRTDACMIGSIDHWLYKCLIPWLVAFFFVHWFDWQIDCLIHGDTSPMRQRGFNVCKKHLLNIQWPLSLLAKAMRTSVSTFYDMSFSTLEHSSYAKSGRPFLLIQRRLKALNKTVFEKAHQSFALPSSSTIQTNTKHGLSRTSCKISSFCSQGLVVRSGFRTKFLHISTASFFGQDALSTKHSTMLSAQTLNLIWWSSTEILVVTSAQLQTVETVHLSRWLSHVPKAIQHAFPTVLPGLNWGLFIQAWLQNPESSYPTK